MKCGNCRFCFDSRKSPTGHFCGYLFSNKYVIELDTECSITDYDWFLQKNE